MARGGRLDPEQGQRFLGQEQVDVVVIGCGDERQVDNNACRAGTQERRTCSGWGSRQRCLGIEFEFRFQGPV